MEESLVKDGWLKINFPKASHALIIKKDTYCKYEALDGFITQNLDSTKCDLRKRRGDNNF